ncbi:hypothetical protein NEF87_004899 [Candidatus Lokiarchaeum ossiferum]|uniref:Uncharacterized protein n=1 Tax=Candidatus Lokiarchaeum ossiferum TaxID=2951803 RepID=A0ABY6I1P6_9ARCH|nr:hypothetical protein NEF87_004899 [Candidatus Lokiarchaeum sp. B-35]
MSKSGNFENKDVEDLFNILCSEYSRINKIIEDQPPCSNPPPNFEQFKILLDHNVLFKYGQLEVMQFHPEIFQILKKIFLEFNEDLHVGFSLDYYAYKIKIGSLYNKIVQETFIVWKFFFNQFKSKLHEIIKDWRSDFNELEMDISIILPLKGFYLNKKEITPFIIISDDNSTAIFQNIPNYSVYTNRILIDRSSLKFGLDGISNQFSPYCILIKSKIPFDVLKRDESGKFFMGVDHPENPIKIWEHVKHFVQVLALEGNPIKFGKPFYHFPWWISKRIINLMKFMYPDWIDSQFFINHEYSEIVPDYYTFNNDMHNYNRDYIFYSIENNPRLKKDMISQYSSNILDPTEIFANELSKKISQPCDFDHIKEIWYCLTNYNQNINFSKSEFLLHSLLRIGSKT